jgi:adhesin/invasin
MLMTAVAACAAEHPSTVEPNLSVDATSGALTLPGTLASAVSSAGILRLEAVTDTVIDGVLGGQAALKVMVSDTAGRLIHNAVVNFQPVVGHGAVTRATVNSTLRGEAANTWRYGPSVGEQTLRVWVQGAPDTLTFTATLPGPHDVSAVSATTLNGAYAANTIVTVLVTDSSGNPFQSASVTFAPDSNAGAVTYPVVRTNNRGEAKVTWTFGTATAGSQRLRVRVDGLTDTLVFTATVDGPPVAVALQSMTDSSLTGITGSSRTLSVLVRDQRGQPMPRAAVTFRTLENSGSVLPSPAVSGKTGVANATWTFARQAGTQTVLVTAQGIDDTLRFVATVKAPPIATEIVAISDTTITGRTGEATVLQVKVLDADGDPFPNASVKFKAITGRGSMQISIVKSGRDGIAKSTWAYGGVLGEQEATAELVGVTGTTQSFVSIVTVGAPKVVVAATATTGRADVGDTLSTEPAVKVTDNYGNPVEGVTVIFRVTAGGGTIESTSVLTDEDGIASGGAWVMGQAGGVNRVTATVQAPIARGNPVQFSANAIP